MGKSIRIAALIAVSACAAPQFKNALHPEYGPAQYQQDLADCRRTNTKVVQTGGYDDASKAVVDEDAAKACIAQRGWRQV